MLLPSFTVSITRKQVKGDETMTKTRIFLTGLAALFVAELLASIVHGYVLAADYAPYYGKLLRGGADPRGSSRSCRSRTSRGSADSFGSFSA